MKKLTTLFLVRHGQTQWNVANRMQGQFDSPLTLLGIEQSIHVKQKLCDENIHIVYSSPLLRAIKTSQLIIKNHPIELITRNRLAEMQLGPWQGKTHQQISQSHPQQSFNFWKKPCQYQLKGAESFHELQQRAIKEIKCIFTENKGKNILVVSHGLLIKVILGYIKQVDLSSITDIATPVNGCCIRLKQIDDLITTVDLL